MAFIGDWLEDFARATPGQTALSQGDAKVSWQDLEIEVAALERHICRNSSTGSRVALALSSPVALIICFLACARSGRVAMVFDIEWPQAQLDFVRVETKPELLIDDESFAARARSKGFRKTDQGVSPEGAPGEADPFYIGFTSGSTGVPKGYLRTHGSWLKSFELSDAEFGVVESARVILAGKLVHSLHLYGAIYGLARGQEVVLLPFFEPRLLLREIAASDQGAILYATPTQVHYLAETAARTDPEGALRQVLVSGAKWRDEDRRRLSEVFPKAELFEFYGASETSFITVSGAKHDVPAGSVGRAASGVVISIGEPVSCLPSGKSGAIWVKSPLLFSGYVCGGSDDTRWCDGWLTFGDHGYLDNNGYLYVTGRANRMVITSGLNVYPEEVEAALLEHPAVELAVVLGLPDAIRGQVLEAVIVPSAMAQETRAEIRAYCRNRLVAGKVPRKFHFREQLPLTAGGKPDLQKITAEIAGTGSKTS